ncbi:MAG: MFS transporter [Bacteroidia bacterium]|nr:MFS transporter [Bacteroidia bacterium]
MKWTDAHRLRLLYFLVFACTASWLPIFADYLHDHGLSGLESATVLSITPVMMLLAQPLYGMIADRIGYRRCLILSAALAALAYTGYLYAGGFGMLLLLTLAMALFYNTLQPLLDTLALRWVEQHPDFSYGSLRLAGAAGWAFTGIIVGWYIDALNTTVIFAFAAGTMALTALVALSLAPDNLSPRHQHDSSWAYLREVLTRRELLLILLFVCLVSAGATTIWNFYSLYLKDNGASASLVGLGLSLQGLCELPFFYFSARIITRLGLKHTLLLTTSATALRLFLYYLIRVPEAALAIELLHGLSWSLFWVACVGYVNQLVPEHWRATGQSLLYAAYLGAGAILGNYWTEWLLGQSYSLAEVFRLNALLVALTVLGMWRFVRPDKLAPSN